MNTLTFSDAPTAAHLATITPAHRRTHGKRLRDRVPRADHDEWQAPSDRADPIGILRAADATRQPDLVPLRYGPHAAVAVHFLPRVRRRHGGRSGPHAGQRHSCAGMWRLPFAELRRI